MPLSKFDSCVTSLNLRDSVPVDALRATAKQYQEQRGLDPAAAMLRAVEDQLQLAQMEKAQIEGAVQQAWEAQGGAKKVPTLAPPADAAPAVGPEPVAEQPAEPQPAPDDVEAALAGPEVYTLPDDIYKDWNGSAREDFKPTPRQQMVMDSAARAKDSGLFYTNEVQAFVEKDLNISAELRARKNHGTEGGDVGYDIYHAAKAVDEQRGNAEIRRVQAEMGLKVGDKIGTLIFNDFKVNTGVTVEAVNDTMISLSGKRGAYGVKMDASVTNIKYAIERAHEKGKRKDSYEQFIASRAQPAAEAKPKAPALQARDKKKAEKEGDLRASMPDKVYTQRELEEMDTDALDRLAFGVADGDVIELSPDQIVIQYEGDLENPQHAFDTQGGMKWARSVDLSEPVEVEVHDDGKYHLADGHHRWFAAGKTKRKLQAEVKIKGNPVKKVLADQDARNDLRASLTDMRTIEVDGQRRPIRNSAGELVAPDFSGQVEFWKQYTGPVDERGRPVVEPQEGDTRAAENPIASDIDAQVAQAVKDGTTADKLLALIESESNRPELRELATALRRQNLQTKIAFGNPQGRYLSGNAEQANGAYRQSDDTAFIGKEFGAAQTALHELVHASTLRALQRGGRAAQQIRALHKYIATMPSFAGMYGATDPEEFISEALTSPTFRQQLADTPAPGAKLSIWQKLVGIVRMVLGLPAAKDSVLDRVMSAAPDLFAENQARGPIPSKVAPDGTLRAAAREMSAAFKRWFGDSKVVNANGQPLVVYRGSVFDESPVADVESSNPNNRFGKAFYAGSLEIASEYTYANIKDKQEFVQSKEGEARKRFSTQKEWEDFVAKNYRKGDWHELIGAADNKGVMYPMYMSIKNPATNNTRIDGISVDFWADAATKSAGKGEKLKNRLIEMGYDGVIFETTYNGKPVTEYVAFHSGQVKSATGNSGAFDPDNPDIRASMPSRMADAIGNGLQAATLSELPAMAANRLKDFRNVGLQFLGRRQLVDLYADQFKAGNKESTLQRYSDLMQQMDADKNEAGAEADGIADRWGKLADADKLADLMHDSTLAQIDPTKDYIAGDDRAAHTALKARLAALSPEARAIYAEARDAYHKHWMKVRAEIRSRIERAMPESPRRAKLLEKMDATFYEKVKGVYFPLARFGDYVVSVTDKNGTRLSVNFAETTNEAEALRRELLRKFPAADGHVVSKITKKKEFNAGRDAVSRGFMQELFGVLDQYEDSAELQDDINQLYLQSMPDLSWTKHGIHRKGTPGFSQDARRAFAQNLFHGARYLAKLRYGDRLADFLDEMQDHVDAQAANADYDSVRAQQVVDEMVKRHEAYMSPQGNSLSNALTSVGFLFYLGLSPASAVVNLTQTPLVTLPMLAAKHGFAKASSALLAAAKQTAGAKNDISKVLTGDELRAYQQAVDAGVIDVSMAHDLAGIASGDDTKAHGKLRPVMKWASFMFHHGEKFNRQASLLAAYRLARGAGMGHDAAYKSAVDEVYASHFDYSSGNRARVMQGPVARVVLLFKQYAQNMIYTLTRNAVLAAKGDKVALRTLSGLLLSHAMAAGVLGLPVVGTLLSAATLIGGDDDEPWDAKIALRNYIADLIGQKPAEVLMHGMSRLTPFDISGRVGLDKLILPDVQEGLEGARAAESWMTAALGPVAGIGLSAAKGAANIAEGRYLRGLEDMMPVSVRNPIKALRLNSEGVRDKSGIPILDDTSAIEEIGQLIGFSPSRSREAMEGKSAVYQAERRLTDRRQALVEQWAHARQADDAEGAQEVWEAIQRWNQKQPGRRITMPALVQSLRSRNKRIREAEDGIYLPKKHADVRELGRFATAGD